MEKCDVAIYLVGGNAPLIIRDLRSERVDFLINAINHKRDFAYALINDTWVNPKYVAAVVCKENTEDD